MNSVMVGDESEIRCKWALYVCMSFVSQENLDIFREELKESSQALSDILGEAPAMNAIGLTPQVVENELPVLASSKPGSVLTTPTHTITSSAPTSRPNLSHSTNSLAGGGLDGMDDHPVPGGATTPTTSRKRRRPSVERWVHS